MKKLFKVCCLILALCVLLSCTSLAATVKPPDIYGVLENSRLAANVGAPERGEVSARYTYYSGTRYYYNQINANAKAIHDAIVSASPGTTSFSVPVPNPVTGEELSAVVQAGVFSVFKDHPEIFWYTGGAGFGASGGYYDYSSGTEVIVYTTVEITLSLSAAYPDIAATKSALETAINNFIPVGETRYEKVKSIHDFISLKVVYDYSFTNPTAHEATSALLEPFLPVCEGYSEAFKIICDKYSIPCVIVTGLGNGGAHMWNYVQMEDGKWYAVDVTWDDQGTTMAGIYTDYFLVGSATQNTYFGGETFGEDHVPSGKWVTSDDAYIFTYPTLSTTAYTRPLNLGMALPVGAQKNQSSRELTFIPNEYGALAGYKGLYYNAVATSAGKGTGASITMPTGSSNANQLWRVIVRGDVNGDALANATDLDKILNAGVGLSSGISSGSDYAKAADLNGDGAIDAIDAAYLELYTRRHYDFS